MCTYKVHCMHACSVCRGQKRAAHPLEQWSYACAGYGSQVFYKSKAALTAKLTLQPPPPTSKILIMESSECYKTIISLHFTPRNIPRHHWWIYRITFYWGHLKPPSLLSRMFSTVLFSVNSRVRPKVSRHQAIKSFYIVSPVHEYRFP